MFLFMISAYTSESIENARNDGEKSEESEIMFQPDSQVLQGKFANSSNKSVLRIQKNFCTGIRFKEFLIRIRILLKSDLISK